jgi:hypothetical protein
MRIALGRVRPDQNLNIPFYDCTLKMEIYKRAKGLTDNEEKILFPLGVKANLPIHSRSN